MKDKDVFAKNLRILISYSKSISSISRDLRISRQQFTRYLAGKNLPSVRNMRKISDYFGVDETEILMPVEDFHKMISLNPPRSVQTDPVKSFFTSEYLDMSYNLISVEFASNIYLMSYKTLFSLPRDFICSTPICLNSSWATASMIAS